MRKLESYKFGINDKELGNRILYEIAMKYDFILPTAPRPEDLYCEEEDTVDETKPKPLFEIDEDEAKKNKEFLHKLGTKIGEGIKSLTDKKKE